MQRAAWPVSLDQGSRGPQLLPYVPLGHTGSAHLDRELGSAHDLRLDSADLADHVHKTLTRRRFNKVASLEAARTHLVPCQGAHDSLRNKAGSGGRRPIR